MATLASFRETAAAALAQGDYATALPALEAAALLLATTPDSGLDAARLNWDRDAIQAQILRCKRALAAAAGVRRQHITYTRPGDTGDYT